MMVDGRGVKTENLKKNFKAILEIKKKKEGQYEKNHKNSPNLGSRLLSRGSEHTIQNRMVNKNCDNDKIRILLLIY